MAATNQHVQDIPAPQEEVWNALTDLHRWHEWNPTLVEPQGELVVGSVVRMKLVLGRRQTKMRQKIIEVTPPSVLRWESRFGPTWLFLVTRSFRLERIDENTTRLDQSEIGTGLLARLIFVFTGPPTVRGFVAIADALTARLSH